MNTWQDWVLAACLLALNLALLPLLLGKNKPRLITSTLTALFLLPQLVVFFSLSLWYTFSMVCINALFWIILAFQSARQSSNKL